MAVEINDDNKHILSHFTQCLKSEMALIITLEVCRPLFTTNEGGLFDLTF
jgi:hypothetical protein